MSKPFKNSFRVFVEHEKRQITVARLTVNGTTWAQAKVIGVDLEAVAQAVAQLRVNAQEAFDKAFATPYIPSTGLLGPRPYRAPEVAREEEMQERAGKEVANG
jgi:hypothetical protein